MYTVEHEILVDLVRHRPRVVASLLAALGLVAEEDVNEASLCDTSVPQAVPPERRVDAVVRLTGLHDLVVLLEVQLRPDPVKRWTWPVYLTAVRERQRCPGVVMVLTLDEATARWAEAPIVLGPGNTFRVVVVGPERIPVVTDPAVARASMETAILSSLVHGRGPWGLEVGRAAIGAIHGVDMERGSLYIDLVLRSLHEVARKFLEASMIEAWEPQTEFVKNLVARWKQEREAGREEGREAGREEGREEGERRLLRRQLQRRFGSLPAPVEARITQASEEDILRWGDAVLLAGSLEDVFGD